MRETVITPYYYVIALKTMGRGTWQCQWQQSEWFLKFILKNLFPLNYDFHCYSVMTCQRLATPSIAAHIKILPFLKSEILLHLR